MSLYNICGHRLNTQGAESQPAYEVHEIFYVRAGRGSPQYLAFYMYGWFQVIAKTGGSGTKFYVMSISTQFSIVKELPPRRKRR
jgi:hypothetical protein